MAIRPKRGSKRARRGRALPPALHELESEVMEQLWSTGEATVRSVMEALNGRAGRDRAYTTYMTVMGRLDGKGLLERRREGKTDYYRPVYEREEYMGLRAQAEVADLVTQYGDVALSHFAQQMASLDPARRRALQRLARKG
jgi:predicted transcriptional regulator